jgi:hypothetical protein
MYMYYFFMTLGFDRGEAKFNLSSVTVGEFIYQS